MSCQYQPRGSTCSPRLALTETLKRLDGTSADRTRDNTVPGAYVCSMSGGACGALRFTAGFGPRSAPRSKAKPHSSKPERPEVHMRLWPWLGSAANLRGYCQAHSLQLHVAFVAEPQNFERVSDNLNPAWDESGCILQARISRPAHLVRMELKTASFSVGPPESSCRDWCRRAHHGRNDALQA